MHPRISRSQLLVIAVLVVFAKGGLSADADWGNLRGRFIYGGERPSPTRLEVTVDANAFHEPIFDESLIVDSENLGVANVVLYLLPPRDPPLNVHPSLNKHAHSLVEFEFKNGRIAPHIVLARTTQTIIERSSGNVFHNANVLMIQNSPSGMIRPLGKPVLHRLPREEPAPIPVRCNIHPWENAFLVLRSNPYMAKTDVNGRFTIRNLPVGTHTFQVWHERAGYLRNVKGPVSTDAKGRFQVSVGPGTQDVPDTTLPASIFATTSDGD